MVKQNEQYKLSLSVQPYEMPSDEYWSSLDKVPRELARIAKIYAGALENGVDRTTQEFISIDDFYKVYDGMAGQANAVAWIGDKPVGVASFDLTRKPPFIDGVAVHSSMRGMGIGQALLGHVIDIAAEQGAEEIHARSQPSSLPINMKMLSKLGVAHEVNNTGKYPRIIMRPSQRK